MRRRREARNSRSAYGVDEKEVGIMLEKAYWEVDGSEGGGERVRV